VPLTVTVEGERTASLYPLNPDGTRRPTTAEREEGGRRLFELGPEHQTLWYELVID
jgi:hypothetical protein